MPALDLQELQTILDEHARWLLNKDEGRQAIFKDVDLSGRQPDRRQPGKKRISAARISVEPT